MTDPAPACGQCVGPYAGVPVGAASGHEVQAEGGAAAFEAVAGFELDGLAGETAELSGDEPERGVGSGAEEAVVEVRVDGSAAGVVRELPLAEAEVAGQTQEAGPSNDG
jgi:hypothetical protein